MDPRCSSRLFFAGVSRLGSGVVEGRRFHFERADAICQRKNALVCGLVEQHLLRRQGHEEVPEERTLRPVWVRGVQSATHPEFPMDNTGKDDLLTRLLRGFRRDFEVFGCGIFQLCGVRLEED